MCFNYLGAFVAYSLFDFINLILDMIQVRAVDYLYYLMQIYSACLDISVSLLRSLKPSSHRADVMRSRDGAKLFHDVYVPALLLFVRALRTSLDSASTF